MGHRFKPMPLGIKRVSNITVFKDGFMVKKA